MNHPHRCDAAVVGAGLAGLTAAAFLARAGLRVVVLDKADAVGGRARTTVAAGFHLNFGPHALYRSGVALRTLHELGIRPRGATPPASGYALLDGRLHALPAGPISLLGTGLLGLAGKLEAARLLAALGRIDPQPHDSEPARAWLDARLADPTARALVEALFRLTSYANDPARQSAGANLRQLQAALADSVLYLDGGWQSVVAELRAAALGHGAVIHTRERVDALTPGSRGYELRLGNGASLVAGAVVLAVDPQTVRRLLGDGPGIDAWLGTSLPVHAACLDVGLRRLPRPRATFALGIDRPLYFSVHTTAARLAPDAGGAVLHALLYQPGDAPVAAAAAEAELEDLVDRLQPGWRDQVVVRRFLPHMTVTHGAPVAARGGLGGRPGVAVPGFPGVCVAGDWAGGEGMLADASVASARRAAAAILAQRGVAGQKAA